MADLNANQANKENDQQLGVDTHYDMPQSILKFESSVDSILAANEEAWY